MALLSWGKPNIETTTSTNGAPAASATWTAIDVPKDTTTKLTPTAGTEVEAVEEGGDVVDSRTGKNKYQFEFDHFVKKRQDPSVGGHRRHHRRRTRLPPHSRRRGLRGYPNRPMHPARRGELHHRRRYHAALRGKGSKACHRQDGQTLLQERRKRLSGVRCVNDWQTFRLMGNGSLRFDNVNIVTP